MTERGKKCESLSKLSEKALTDFIQLLSREVDLNGSRCRSLPRKEVPRRAEAVAKCSHEFSCTDSLGNLEKVLHVKLRDNERLRAFNARLQTEAGEQERQILGLSNQLLLLDEVRRESGDIQRLKERVGDCNVEIQRLKKELQMWTKRNERELANRKREKNRNSARAETFRSCMSRLDVNKALAERKLM